MNSQLTLEEQAAEKVRLQKLQEESDMVLTCEAFGEWRQVSVINNEGFLYSVCFIFDSSRINQAQLLNYEMYAADILLLGTKK